MTGGRDFRDREWLYAGLDLLNDVSGGITEVIEGGAPGADTLAANWARWRGINLQTVRAEWDRFSRGLRFGQKNPAGMIRNNMMVALRPDVVLAAPGGNGTAHMVSQSQKAGLKVVFLERMPVARGPASASELTSPLPLVGL